MKFLTVLILISLPLISHAQFFYDNPVDSGTFYLKVFNRVGDQEQTVRCGKVKLMYFYQPHRAGLSFKDATMMAKPDESREFTYTTFDGLDWRIAGLQSNDNTPDILEFIRLNSKGYSYKLSPGNICLQDLN